MKNLIKELWYWLRPLTKEERKQAGIILPHEAQARKNRAKENRISP